MGWLLNVEIAQILNLFADVDLDEMEYCDLEHLGSERLLVVVVWWAEGGGAGVQILIGPNAFVTTNHTHHTK